MLDRARTNSSFTDGSPCSHAGQLMRVRLVRKFANALNGLDLTKVSVGDVIDVAPHVASMLILEGWGSVESEGVDDD